MSNLGILLFGITLLFVGLGLHVYAWNDHIRQFAAVARENTKIDESNPPQIVMRRAPAGGATFSNEGGFAKHTPPDDFTSYEDVIDKIDHGLRWYRMGGSLCAVGGLLLVFASVGRFFVGG